MTHKRTSTLTHPPAHAPTHTSTPEDYSPTTKKGANGRASHASNMGRVQRDPLWQEPEGTLGKWSDHGEGNHLRSHEAADREEREAYGRPLPAAYRYLLGPAPALSAGERDGARAYLLRIEAAIEQGGWTRSEARRLRKLKDKWRARANGKDARFAEVGNRRGGLDKLETANVAARRKMVETKRLLLAALKAEGD